MAARPLDVALVYPFLRAASWKNALRSKDNLGLGYLSSSLARAGLTAEILNAEHLELDADGVAAWILERKPPVVGLSCTAQRSYDECRAIATRIKAAHRCSVLIGGIFPSIAPPRDIGGLHRHRCGLPRRGGAPRRGVR